MKKKETSVDYYKNLIQSFFSYPVKITEPEISGGVHQLFIVDTGNKDKMVFRFSEKECAMRNFNNTRVLRQHGIPVPEIHVYRLDNSYCETYPFIEGKTLEERIQSGIRKKTLDKIYRQIVDISLRMAKIPSHLIEEEKTTNSAILYKLMAMESDKVCHADIHSKNILLDNKDNVIALLDMDSIRKAPLSLIMTRIFTDAQKYGYTLRDVARFCPEAYKGKLFNIEEQRKIYNFLYAIKKMLSGEHLLKRQRLQNKSK